MMRAALREDWKALPCPKDREWFELPMLLTRDEEERVRQGFVPKDMDDRWFLFVEDDVLYCHRSWTGACIFGAHIESNGDGARLTRCWVSREPAQYQSAGIGPDRTALRELILTFLLRR